MSLELGHSVAHYENRKKKCSEPHRPSDRLISRKMVKRIPQEGIVMALYSRRKEWPAAHYGHGGRRRNWATGVKKARGL